MRLHITHTYYIRICNLYYKNFKIIYYCATFNYIPTYIVNYKTIKCNERFATIDQYNIIGYLQKSKVETYTRIVMSLSIIFNPISGDNILLLSVGRYRVFGPSQSQQMNNKFYDKKFRKNVLGR